jgi:adenylate cyclase class 2
MNPLNYKDFCIKAHVTDLEGIERILQDMKASFMGIDHQKDIYFKVREGKLKLRLGAVEKLITHYKRTDNHGVEKTIVFRYDLNPTDEDITKLYHNHEELGIVEKERKIYFVGNVKIHLDTMPDHSHYVEIEVLDRDNTQSDETLFRQGMDMMNILQIKDEALIKTGYLDTP